MNRQTDRRESVHRCRARAAGVAAVLTCSTALFAQSDGNAIAIVNGTPISRDRIHELLVESHGLEILQQVIILELAKQESGRHNLSVGQADIDAEFKRSLDQMTAGVSGADEPQKMRALRDVLEKKGLSMVEFMLTMERNAHLRKLADRGLSLDERLVREEFARTYDEKVQARHIQLGDLNEVVKATEMLRSGRDFADVARELSRNPQTAPNGGELPPFAFNDSSIPPALREAAFSLKEGETSTPVRIDAVYHIVKLERRIGPDNVRYEDVREQVAARLRERGTNSEMGRLAQELFAKARVRVLDPKLRTRYEELVKASKLESVTQP